MYMYNIVLDSLDNPTIDEIMDALEEMAIKYSKADDVDESPANDENDVSDCADDCEHCEFTWKWATYLDDTSENEYDIHDDPSSFPVHPITPNHDHVTNHDQEEYDAVDHPFHYTSHGLETIEKIEAVIDGLPAKEAALLSNVLKYFDRSGMKGDAATDLSKANNYAHRLVYGEWRHNHD